VENRGQRKKNGMHSSEKEGSIENGIQLCKNGMQLCKNGRQLCKNGRKQCKMEMDLLYWPSIGKGHKG